MVGTVPALGALAYKDKFKRFPDLIVSKVASEGDYTTIKDGIEALTIDKSFLGIKSGIFQNDGDIVQVPNIGAGRGARVSGAGMGATVIKALDTGNNSALYWADIDFLTIENLTIDGNSVARGFHATHANADYCACWLENTGFYRSQDIQEGLVTFRNVCFRNAPNHGIRADGNVILLFDGCVFEKNGGDGIWLESAGSKYSPIYTIFNNCFFYNNSLDPSHPLTFDGAYIDDMNDKHFVKFSGCYAFDRQTVKTQRYGFKSVDSDYLEFFNVMAVNNGTGGFSLSGTNNRMSHCRE